MKNVLLGSALLLSVAATPAFAGPNWNEVSGAYLSVSDGDDSIDGFKLSGTKLLNSNVFVAGSYKSISDEEDSIDVSINTLSLGVGYRHGVSPSTDVFGVISYEDLEVEGEEDGFSVSASQDGFGLKVGLRSLVNEKVELSGAISHVDIKSLTATGIEVDAKYKFTPQFSAGIGYSTTYSAIDDLDEVSLEVAYSF